MMGRPSLRSFSETFGGMRWVRNQGGQFKDVVA